MRRSYRRQSEMKYKGKKILLTGASGFIGNALALALTNAGARVIGFNGDIRERNYLSSYIDRRLDYVFHFAAPSSQILFKRNAPYCYDVTINGFLNVADACRQNGVKLIYPSTGILSQGRMNEYARAKKVCEDIHLGTGLDALGLRIFAGYGIGEAHKRDYASVPYIFTRNVLDGIMPVIYGDGTQSRDFIYIDDLVNAILVLAENATEQIIDVGSGTSTTFNEILATLKDVHGKGFSVSNIPAPKNYVEKTSADVSIMQKYNCEAKTTILEGIEKIYKYEKGNRNHKH